MEHDSALHKQKMRHEANASHHTRNHNGHGHNHHKMMIEDFKKRFYLSLFITIPILILSPMIQDWLNFEIVFSGKEYVVLILSTFLFFYGGWPFLTGLKDELKKRAPGMMTLIAMAISVAYIYSAAVVFGLKGNDFFWELGPLINIMLLGHWIEMKSVLSASNALEKLSELMPNEAHLITEQGIEDVKIETLAQGNHVLIKPGEKIPADGIITKGKSSINESMLTGESKPINKKENDEIIGGSINGEGALEVRIEKLGKDSYLSKFIDMVQQAQESKSKTQTFADKAAFWLTILALTVGFSTLIIWLILGKDLTFSIERMATVMVIACPHALGLATPLVVSNSTALSAKNGLLIRNRTAFENAGKISTLVFDKTGTLTRGNFGVNFIHIMQDTFSEEEIIRLAATLEQNSEHPIATGILKKANEMNSQLYELSEFQAIKGKGVQGIVNGRRVSIVSPGYLKEQNVPMPTEINQDALSTIVFVLSENKLIAAIGLSDEIRSESYEAIKNLHQSNIKCWMLTGDNKNTAEKVSKELGLDGYFAEVLPDEKQAKIKELQGKEEFVAMTGDGVNDAPALAQANVGIAIGSGTDVAAETADIILVNSNPQDVVSLIKFGGATYRKMVQNLLWATGYNIFALPLAAGALYSVGIVISPAVGAVLMSLSTVIVAINAKLLKL